LAFDFLRGRSPLNSSAPETRKPFRVGDDVAYAAPMAVFLAFTWAGDQWPGFYPQTYAAKTVITAALLWAFRAHYTRISWKFAWLGVIVGILGVFQWVGMEKFILGHWPNYPRMPHQAFIPTEHFHNRTALWFYLAVRWSGASLVVPVMEELFWRDFLWRTLLAPNDFKLAAVGEWNLKVFLIVAVAFGAGVHIEWITAIVWGLMIGGLLAWKKSLGACIVCHAVTNFLLGAYVLYSGQWGFW
jgi:CAAX prenyl protease-like protein